MREENNEEITAVNFLNWFKTLSHRFKGILNTTEKKHKEKDIKTH